METLHDPPTVVLTPEARGRLKIHFLPITLANIADVEIVGLTVERKAPGVSHSPPPDFRSKALHSDEGIARGHGVCRGTSGLDIDTQDFPEQLGPVLRVIWGITGASTITCADVEEAIALTKSKLSTIVICVYRVGNLENDLFTVEVSNVGVSRTHSIPGNHDVAGGIGVVDVEILLGGKARRKSETKEATLAARRDAGTDVEERRRVRVPFLIRDLPVCWRQRYPLPSPVRDGDGCVRPVMVDVIRAKAIRMTGRPFPLRMGLRFPLAGSRAGKRPIEPTQDNPFATAYTVLILAFC